MASYTEVGGNQQFYKAARNTLLALGREDPGSSMKKTTDAILKEFRYFNTNSPRVIEIGSRVKNFSPQQKADFKTAFEGIRSMDEGVPVWDAITDYGGAIFSDPINIIALASGFFTAGTTTATTLAAREAAKQSVKGYIKNKVAAMTSPSMVKTLAVESGILGLGGTARSFKAQDVEKDVGLRQQTSVPQAFATGLIEGPASVVAGYGAGVLIGAGAKLVDNKLMSSKREIPGVGSVSNATNWLKSTFLPKNLADEGLQRLSERQLANSNTNSSQGFKVAKNIEKFVKKFYGKNINEGNKLVTKAIRGDQEALKNLPSELQEQIYTYKKLQSEIGENAANIQIPVRDANSPTGVSYRSPLKTTFLNLFQNNDDYLRTIYRAFVSPKEQTAQRFEDLMADGSVISELSSLIKSKPEWVDNLPKNVLKKFTLSDLTELRNLNPVTLRKLAKAFFDSSAGRFRIDGSEEAKVVLQNFQERLWGKDFSPDLAITQTIEGQLSLLNRTQFGASMAINMLDRGLGVLATSAKEAAEIFNARQQVNRVGGVTPDDIIFDSDMVRVFGEGPNTLIRVPSGRLDTALEGVYIPRTLAARMKPAFSSFIDNEAFFKSGVLNNALNKIATAQASIKIGKVPLNPVAIYRNMTSAVQAIFGTGQMRRGLQSLITNYRPLSTIPVEQRAAAEVKRKTLSDVMSRIGILSTSADLNQILVRLGRDLNEKPKKMEIAASLGFAALSPKIYNALLKSYGKVDDLSKMLSFLGELDAEQAVWKTLTTAQKAERRKLVEDGMPKRFVAGQVPSESTVLRRADDTGEILSTELQVKPDLEIPPRTELRYTDDEIIQEIAARNTLNNMPIYQRAPAFIEAMRRIPILGNFAAFPAESFRNAVNLMSQGAQEIQDGFRLNNQVLINKGMARLASFYAVAGGIYGVASYINEKNGFSKVAGILRNYLPEWEKNGAIAIHKIKEGPNNDVVIDFVNLGYTNPYTHLTSTVAPLILAASQGNYEATLTEGARRAFAAFSGPFLDPSLVNQSFEELRKGNLAEVFRLATPTIATTAIDSLVQSGAFKSDKPIIGNRTVDAFVDSITPDFIYKEGTSLRDVENIFGKSKFYGEGYKPPKDLESLNKVLAKKGYNFSGLSTRTVSLRTATGFALRHLKETSDEERLAFKKNLVPKLEDPATTIDRQKLRADYEEVLKTQFALSEGKLKMYNDLVNIAGLKKARVIWLDSEVKAGNQREVAKLTLLKEPLSHITRISTDRRLLKNLVKRFDEKRVSGSGKLEPNPDYNPAKLQEISEIFQILYLLEENYDAKRILDGVPD